MRSLPLHPRAICTLARKDLWDALVNLRLLVLILIPIGFSILYSFIFSSAGDITQAKIVLYDPETSMLASALGADEDVRLIEATSAEDVPSLVTSEGAQAGLVLTKGFDARMQSGQQPPLTIYYNHEQQRRMRDRLQRLLKSALRRAAGQEPPVKIVFSVLDASPPSAQRDFDLKGFLLLLFILMNLTMTGLMISPSLLVEEKEKKTLRALLVTPLSRLDVIFAKGLAGWVYTVLGATVILALNRGLGGQVALTAIIIVLSAVVTVLIGLCMGALFRDANAMNTWSSIIMLPLLLAGIMVPIGGIFNLGPIETVMHIIPTYYTAHALFLTFSATATFATLSGDLIAILVSIVLFGGVATILLRTRN